MPEPEQVEVHNPPIRLISQEAVMQALGAEVEAINCPCGSVVKPSGNEVESICSDCGLIHPVK